ARIDMQLRRLADGSTKVADRLRREVLFYCAISAPSTPQVADVQRVFKLASLIPSPDAPSADMLRLQPLLRKARDEITSAKDAWLKFTSGRVENLARLRQTMASVRELATEIGEPSLIKLVASLAKRLDDMPAVHIRESLALEYATGLLFAENAFENYPSVGNEFAHQVQTMLARLDAAAAGATPSAHLPLLDDLGKRAQERLLLANVCREVQANLRRM